MKIRRFYEEDHDYVFGRFSVFVFRGRIGRTTAGQAGVVSATATGQTAVSGAPTAVLCATGTDGLAKFVLRAETRSAERASVSVGEYAVWAAFCSGQFRSSAAAAFLSRWESRV